MTMSQPTIDVKHVELGKIMMKYSLSTAKGSDRYDAIQQTPSEEGEVIKA